MDYPGYNYDYQAAADTDIVVCDQPAILHGIIVGADVGSAVIEVSDHASDGDGNVKIYIAGSNIATDSGYFIPTGDMEFKVGICADLTNQTNVTFVFRQITSNA